jgi:hypothetical protein
VGVVIEVSSEVEQFSRLVSLKHVAESNGSLVEFYGDGFRIVGSFGEDVVFSLKVYGNGMAELFSCRESIERFAESSVGDVSVFLNEVEVSVVVEIGEIGMGCE